MVLLHAAKEYYSLKMKPLTFKRHLSCYGMIFLKIAKVQFFKLIFHTFLFKANYQLFKYRKSFVQFFCTLKKRFNSFLYKPKTYFTEN
jgi:hypothetical protein